MVGIATFITLEKCHSMSNRPKKFLHVWSTWPEKKICQILALFSTVLPEIWALKVLLKELRLAHPIKNLLPHLKFKT